MEMSAAEIAQKAAPAAQTTRLLLIALGVLTTLGIAVHNHTIVYRNEHASLKSTKRILSVR